MDDVNFMIHKLNVTYSEQWKGKRSYYNILCELCYYYIAKFERINCILPRLQEVEKAGGKLDITRETWDRINSLAIELPRELQVGEYARRFVEDEKQSDKPPIILNQSQTSAIVQPVQSPIEPNPSNPPTSPLLGEGFGEEIEGKSQECGVYETSSGYVEAEGSNLPMKLPHPFSSERFGSMDTPGPSSNDRLPTRPKHVPRRSSKRIREPTSKMEEFRSSKLPRRFPPSLADDHEGESSDEYSDESESSDSNN